MNIKYLLACFKITNDFCLKKIVKQYRNHCLSTPSQHCWTNLVLPHQPIKILKNYLNVPFGFYDLD